MNQPLNPYVPPQTQPQQQQRNLGQLIASLGPVSALAGQSVVDPRALAAGIKASFATLTFKGKTWGIRHRGVTQQLLARDPTTGAIIGAIPTVDIVIVKSAMAISKSFYLEKYKEGDFNQPDCWSTNGQVPDMAAPHKQSPTCRGCRWDAFGSRTMDDGRKGKACSDNKRIAVVPAADLKNEAFGGPMLLKLPPSSFAGLSELENQLHMQGYQYFALKMRLSFDHVAAFPKIIFTPFAVLNDYEMQEVLNLQGSDVVERILSEELFEVTADPAQPTPEGMSPNAGAQPQVPAQGYVPPVVTPGVAAPAPQTAQAFQPSVPPQPPVTQGAQVPHVNALVTPSNDRPSNDAGPMPTFLNRTGNPAANGATPPPPAPNPLAAQAETAEQKIARMEAELAALKAPPAPPPETPEQKIARLEAQLAAASKSAPAATPASGRGGRKRTAPVTPAGTQPVVQVQPPQPTPPADTPLPFTAHAAPSAGETDTEGDAPADLDSRIDALLNPGGDKPAS